MHACTYTHTCMHMCAQTHTHVHIYVLQQHGVKFTCVIIVASGYELAEVDVVMILTYSILMQKFIDIYSVQVYGIWFWEHSDKQLDLCYSHYSTVTKMLSMMQT